MIDAGTEGFTLHPLIKSGSSLGLHYQIIVLLLDAEEPLSRGVGVDHPGLPVGQWLVKKMDEVPVVSSMVLG